VKKGSRLCHSCNEYFDAGEDGNENVYYPDGGSIDADRAPICETCYSEDEEVFTIHFFMPDGSEERWGIGHIRANVYANEDGNADEDWEYVDTLDDAQGWRIGWTRTDAWRGYYDETAPEGYAKLGEDAAFGDHQNEVEDRDKRLREIASRLGVELVRCTGRTSNVFSIGVSWWVKGDQATADKFADDSDDPCSVDYRPDAETLALAQEIGVKGL